MNGSKLKILTIALSSLLAIGLVVAILVYLNANRNRVKIGSKDEIFFTGLATKRDAVQLGEALRKSGYFHDEGTSVFLDKDKDGAIVSLVQNEGVWDQPEMLFSAEEVVREIAPSVGGFPIRVKLMDASQQVRKQGIVGRIAVGGDEIFYMGRATASEAKTLGEALVGDKYFQGAGSSVLLAKDDRGTVLSFVVSDGIWDDADSVSAFEDIVKEAASSVGGLPITLRLINTALETRKEIKVAGAADQPAQ